MRRTDTIKVNASSIQEARKKIPHTPGDEFSIVTNIKLVNEEKSKDDQEEERWLLFNEIGNIVIQF